MSYLLLRLLGNRIFLKFGRAIQALPPFSLMAGPLYPLLMARSLDVFFVFFCGFPYFNAF